MRSKLLIAALVLLAVVSAALARVIVQRLDGNQQSVVSTGTALVGGPFTLTDAGGQRVSDGDFRGRWMLVSFGYTYCPDICPLALQVIGQALDRLPEGVEEEVAPIFITVDPERDTPAVLAEFVPAFHPRLVGLTGTPEEIEAVKRAYRVYARKGAGSDGPDYLVDHSTFVYLMGPDGAYVTHFGHATTAEEMAERLEALVTAAS